MSAPLDQQATILASAARTTTQTSADQLNGMGAAYLVLFLNMTVVGTGSVTISVQGYDPTSASYYTIFTGAAVVTNSANRYVVGPGIPVSANVSANDVIPPVYRVVVTANNANPATYSVGAQLVKAA